ncbi:hypothetical protein NEOLEDRAFT_1133652 [Neolentinus lepideus HHB14362 ss-1]|uniref:Uncharacterized protein n=1 Tax=Neolentinus lepideus HHB14362 ss-1 TaxID=1314782 RepID=A0A165SKF5_9AGAM|nr:hypothetical protein NEOLEDRAFT_1133652 [Neolentinus lepideus HHB14362 ss-1]
MKAPRWPFGPFGNSPVGTHLTAGGGQLWTLWGIFGGSTLSTRVDRGLSDVWLELIPILGALTLRGPITKHQQTTRCME